MRRAPVLAVGLALAASVLAGCGSSGGATRFVPSPTGADVEGPGGVHIDPIIPTPSLNGGGGGGSGAGPSSPPSGSSSSGAGPDPLVVATRLSAPTGIALLPDGSALVGERTTGRIVRVQPQAGRPVPTVRTLPGLSTTGDGGLLDLALSPDYAEDNLIYAYVTTPTDNRVVDFTLTGPVTPVLTGIPRGASGNTGRITFGADGDLYVATGDAGSPTDAATPASLAGKVLRVTDIGEPATGNPFPASPVYATDVQGVTGLCASTSSGRVYAVEQRGSAAPVVAAVTAGVPPVPVATLPAADSGSGGCAVQAGRLWVASRTATEIVSATLGETGTPRLGVFAPSLTKMYGRLLTVVPAADGALWLTTSNRDGRGKPVADDERVIRYPPASVGGVTGNAT